MQYLDNSDIFNRENILKSLSNEFLKHNHMDQEIFDRYNVKRGLRNKNGTGVVAGLTYISDVHGYILNNGIKIPTEGNLIYRGIKLNDIVNNCLKEKRFGFEETAWLLLFGKLPTTSQLSKFTELIGKNRYLPKYFSEDMIMKAPSSNIMNKLARSVLALYSYDNNPDDICLENLIRQSIQLIAQLPTIMVKAYQVKRGAYDKKSMYFHTPVEEYSTAENILHMLRWNKKFTEEEARLLDLCLIVHAEHGGGNNSAFTMRVLSSTDTDTYSAVAGAIGSLKGPKHGGASFKVKEMMDYIKTNVSDWSNDSEVKDYLSKIIKKEVGDKSGLVYGIGHAVYTLSDPRAVILKENAIKLAKGTDYEKEFMLYDAIERLTPEIFAEVKGINKPMCANVDLYSGLVYKMLHIPQVLNTPLFAVSRITGWCAHRIEEVNLCSRIIRPAYKPVLPNQDYVSLDKR